MSKARPPARWPSSGSATSWRTGGPMSVNDDRDIAERLGGALAACMPSPAPVGAVLRKGRAIWVRRRIAAGLAAAAAAAAIGAGVPIVLRAGPATAPRPGPASPSRSFRGLPPLRNRSGLFSWVSVNQVSGLAAVSADDIWAVGSAATGRPLIEHWTGRAWTPVPAASPPGAKESLLTSVAAAGPSRAWAVGYYNNGRAIKTLIERWNGRAWTLVPSPSPGGAHGSFLYGVAATGPASAWAVGYSLLRGSAVRTLIERWDGRTWTQVPSPSPGGPRGWSELHAVAAAGPSGAWAVGNYFGPSMRPLIERWNGRAWTYVPSPNPGGGAGGELDAVATTSGSAAWAAGSTGKTVDRALIERWDGRSWRQVQSPSPGGSVLSGPDQSLMQAVCAISPADAWSAGSYSSGNPHGKILIERWNGRTW